MKSSVFSGWAALAASLVFMALVFPTLGLNRLMDVDELTHARVALEAARDGHWLPLTLDGKPWLEKPPVLPWLAGLSIRIFGPSEWAVRLGPAMAASFSLYFLVLLAVEMSGTVLAGLAAALLLGGQVDYLLHARFFTMDSAFLLFFLAALWRLSRVFEESRMGREPRGLLGAGLCLALAAAVKSWFVLSFFPALAIMLYFCRPWPFSLRQVILKLCLPPALCLASWLALYAAVYGMGFLVQEWQVNLFGRVKGAVVSGVEAPNWLFYFYWAKASAPMLLALAAPSFVFVAGRRFPGSRPSAARVTAVFSLALCLTWTAGLMAVNARIINYLLVLEAFLTLAAVCWLAMAESRSQALVLLMAVCLGLAGLKEWVGDLWLMAGSIFLAAWLFLAPGSEGSWKFAPAVRLTAGILLLAGTWRQSWPYLRHPPDPNHAIVSAVMATPAGQPGQTLYYIGHYTQALEFYSRYKVTTLEAMPARPPQESMLVEKDGKAYFYRAR